MQEARRKHFQYIPVKTGLWEGGLQENTTPFPPDHLGQSWEKGIPTKCQNQDSTTDPMLSSALSTNKDVSWERFPSLWWST